MLLRVIPIPSLAATRVSLADNSKLHLQPPTSSCEITTQPLVHQLPRKSDIETMDLISNGGIIDMWPDSVFNIGDDPVNPGYLPPRGHPGVVCRVKQQSPLLNGFQINFFKTAI